MPSNDVSNTLTVTGRSVYMQKGTILKEMYIEYCTILYFSEIK